MADTAALRVRRSRLHKRGDHSLCLPKSCPDAREAMAPASPSPPPNAPPAETTGERTPGGIETAVLAFVAALPYQVPDPRALLALVAVRLAQRVDETGALPSAVRELRVLLVQLTEVPNGPSGVVDEVRLRAAQRKLDNILATAA